MYIKTAESKNPCIVQIRDKVFSRSMTIYDSSVEEIMGHFKRMVRAFEETEGDSVVVHFTRENKVK